jgi:hypothetical protein
LQNENLEIDSTEAAQADAAPHGDRAATFETITLSATKQDDLDLGKYVTAWTEKVVHSDVSAIAQPVRFVDAIGRIYSFPWHQCKTWKGMEDLIKESCTMIDDLNEHVRQGHYDLFGISGEIILPQSWERVIQPGCEIKMLMWPILEEEGLHQDKSATSNPWPSTDGSSRDGDPSELPPGYLRRDDLQKPVSTLDTRIHITPSDDPDPTTEVITDSEGTALNATIQDIPKAEDSKFAWEARSMSDFESVKVRVWLDHESSFYVDIQMPPRGQFTYTQLYESIEEVRKAEYKGPDQECDELEIVYWDEEDRKWYQLVDQSDLEGAVGTSMKPTVAVRAAVDPSSSEMSCSAFIEATTFDQVLDAYGRLRRDAGRADLAVPLPLTRERAKIIAEYRDVRERAVKAYQKHWTTELIGREDYLDVDDEEASIMATRSGATSPSSPTSSTAPSQTLPVDKERKSVAFGPLGRSLGIPAGRVRAFFDFTPWSSNQLAFEKDDIINAAGRGLWLLGRLNGQSGIVPSNHVGDYEDSAKHTALPKRNNIGSAETPESLDRLRQLFPAEWDQLGQSTREKALRFITAELVKDGVDLRDMTEERKKTVKAHIAEAYRNEMLTRYQRSDEAEFSLLAFISAVKTALSAASDKIQ